MSVPLLHACARADPRLAPLFNADGKAVFFLGGQINCSTTIHSRSDILRVLSSSDKDEPESVEADLQVPPPNQTATAKKGFFRNIRMKLREPAPTFNDDREAGMENELINKIAKLNFKNQMKMFYTAYSKVNASTRNVFLFRNPHTLIHPHPNLTLFPRLPPFIPQSAPTNTLRSTSSSPPTPSPSPSSPPASSICSSLTPKPTIPSSITTSSRSSTSTPPACPKTSNPASRARCALDGP